jgi:hypothetical protein
VAAAYPLRNESRAARYRQRPSSRGQRDARFHRPSPEQLVQAGRFVCDGRVSGSTTAGGSFHGGAIAPLTGARVITSSPKGSFEVGVAAEAIVGSDDSRHPDAAARVAERALLEYACTGHVAAVAASHRHRSYRRCVRRCILLSVLTARTGQQLALRRLSGAAESARVGSPDPRAPVALLASLGGQAPYRNGSTRAAPSAPY